MRLWRLTLYTGRYLESSILPLSDTLDIMKIMDEIRDQWGLVSSSREERIVKRFHNFIIKEEYN